VIGRVRFDLLSFNLKVIIYLIHQDRTDKKIKDHTGKEKDDGGSEQVDAVIATKKFQSILFMRH
jgi:hypothetical protein